MRSTHASTVALPVRPFYASSAASPVRPIDPAVATKKVGQSARLKKMFTQILR